eukprot:CAMPEP_0183350786 /NCGR_PEP_ID=MMETSP0164_2-20130417/20778_1 /TAXON_ID=221442 /ORGANISM="Coccolithus pelagicus ssp braarudi, Strain PLY182g" /LENGTH=107 /DNA_ID=CAMNT_0025522773 /DNA_START=44 /DNA_END=365 /DNA_ORIENTATION=-
MWDYAAAATAHTAQAAPHNPRNTAPCADYLGTLRPAGSKYACGLMCYLGKCHIGCAGITRAERRVRTRCMVKNGHSLNHQTRQRRGTLLGGGGGSGSGGGGDGWEGE